jgi:glycosyltransferase involved in cell wall biosynthesis
VRIGLAILNRNESAALPAVLPRIPRDAVDLVFAVDGGSTDGSVGILGDHGIPVLGQASPGRGEAFRMAVEHARGSTDALIFFSPDGNEDPADIARFRPHLEHGADLVIASRMMEGAHNEEDVSWFRPRKWANLFFDWLARVTWGRGQPKITDMINGYRAITLEAWDRLRPDGPGFTIEYQMSIRAYKHRATVVEFPTHEGPRIGGASDAKALRTGLRFVGLYLSELREGRRAGRGDSVGT